MGGETGKKREGVRKGGGGVGREEGLDLEGQNLGVPRVAQGARNPTGQPCGVCVLVPQFRPRTRSLSHP